MSKTKQLVFCSLFTALIAVGAFIKIPVPVVPFTLQYLFTMLAGLILGPRLGTISVAAYISKRGRPCTNATLFTPKEVCNNVIL